MPLGYERTTPILAQYQHLVHVQKVLENMRHTPDFPLVSEDKTKVFLAEVKYRNVITDTKQITTIDEKLDRLLDLRLNDTIDIAKFTEIQKALKSEKANLEVALDQVKEIKLETTLELADEREKSIVYSI